MMRKFSTEIHLALAGMPRKNVPAFRVLRRAWSGRLKDLPGPSIVALAKQLRPLGPWERGFAYELILHHRGALEALKPNDSTLLGRGIRSWGGRGHLRLFRGRARVARAQVRRMPVPLYAFV